MRRITLLSILTLWVLIPGLGTQAQSKGIHLRFANLSPILNPVNIVLNPGPSALNLAFGQITEWQVQPARTYTITLEPSAESTENQANTAILNVIPVEFEAIDGDWLTVIVLGTQETQRIRVLNENYEALNSGDARLTVLYAVDNDEEIDLLLDGLPLYRGLKSATAPTNAQDDLLIVDLVANQYDLTFTEADDASAVYPAPGQKIRLHFKLIRFI